MDMKGEYNHREVEAKAQQYWSDHHSFDAGDDGQRPKFYCLAMFPYPSGRLHMGHVRNYSIGDAIARYKRMCGLNVLQPMGWDAFGLPAENAAIENRSSPREWTQRNIAVMRDQLQQLGFAYDWRRELATCDADYCRWEQWFFLQLYAAGLAYRAESEVNWDPVDQTVLANEQVIDDRGWRSGAKIERRRIMQWQLCITRYAGQLLDGLDQLSGWPREVVTMQRNWIGRSQGVNFEFQLNNGACVEVFTTRPDTVMGATFVAVAPEHLLLSDLQSANRQLREFIQHQLRGGNSEVSREQGDKEGMDTGLRATHPLTGEQLPVWVANFVLMSYGSGAIMCVPAHDQRDYEFASRYGLAIKQVIAPVSGDHDFERQGAYMEEGMVIDSGQFSGQHSTTAARQIAAALTAKAGGEEVTRYRLRDWSISRQRGWGTPIPIIHCPSCGVVPVPDEQLPVLLPDDLVPTGQGSPLAAHSDFVAVQCPTCNTAARRETDTFDTFVESSWYYARFASWDCRSSMLDGRASEWTPVDQYIGGIEHAVMHLLYARFFHKLMRDQGLVTGDEPFTRLLCQGMVLKEGSKMSKSRGNVVDPDQLVARYGADTIRLYILFAAPPRQSLEWSDSGIAGAARFLKRLWTLVVEYTECPKTRHPDVAAGAAPESLSLRRKTRDTIRRVSHDFEVRQQFNTAIAAVMELCNALGQCGGDRAKTGAAREEAIRTVLLLLSPITPHICHALWQRLGGDGAICDQPWPTVDETLPEQDQLQMVLQINGKTRGKFTVSATDGQQEIRAAALQTSAAKRFIAGKKIVRTIIVEGRLCNFVVS